MYAKGYSSVSALLALRADKSEAPVSVELSGKNETST